ncbi:HAMP domain-containing histidine kinase [Halobacillus shinanisalinarum]|uniref:histidine kinase n=1 Tax=Halobacillus shinanisalinarum TaxID=2932258 RepID=A0ABY4H5J2_9BACI|nr:HAMP domain-containing sensor histidine kinase [Halobacillus shinanisalinarum]UOQ95195.1 HAMP domain-containing histidine kinase [Halobacillus shinanisalinarum]
MRLLYQLNVAFTALIIVIMSITAFFIYSLLTDMLVQDELRQLEGRANILRGIANEQNPSERVAKLSQFIQDSNFPMVLFDRYEEEVLFSTLPNETAQTWVENYDNELIEEEVWESHQGESYVVYDLGFAPSRSGMILVIATPLDDLQAVQSSFAGRMIGVFFIGLMLAIVVSYFLTKRLVTPLTRLKKELKKIEKRQFDQVQTVKSSGEIKEVERSVRQMAYELERYITSQKQFFQNASHELKTPLMSIQGYAEGIRDGVFEREAADKGLTVIVSETDRLKKIVNEMILLAKLDSNEDVYHPEETDVVEVITQAKDRMVPLAREKNIVLHFEPSEAFYTYVDSERILQALINMIGNAIRHANHQVTLNSFVKNDTLKFLVTDDGKGIPDDLLPQLFERFIKGKGGETGLGLAISRAIVQRSGGTILAYNNEGTQGATFEITLTRRMAN